VGFETEDELTYFASDSRYDMMKYSRCGRSGLKLPVISFGLWHNFGGVDPFEQARDMIFAAFDLGITHFDLANNYGPPYGSAEETFGRILKKGLEVYRDELIIRSIPESVKWCYTMNHGIPYYRLTQLDRKHRMDFATLSSPGADVPEMWRPGGKGVDLSHHEEKSTDGLSVPSMSFRLQSLHQHDLSTMSSHPATGRVVPTRSFERRGGDDPGKRVEGQSANHLEPAPGCARQCAVSSIEYPADR
jgi:hypothetical protein